MRKHPSIAKRQWNKWTREAQEAFTQHYSFLARSQALMTHPGMPKMKAEHWRTLVHNIAWTVADAVSRRTPHILVCTEGKRGQAAAR